MTLTGNIRKNWTLRKTGKQEPSKRQSTQKKTNIISMEYPSNYQTFGNLYYEKAKQRKQLPNIQPPKPQHHQTESTMIRQQVGTMVPHGSTTKPTNQKRPSNISIPCEHTNTTHTQTPCLMMGEVSLESSPKNIMIQDMINSKTV